jgi:hypothetical protein
MVWPALIAVVIVALGSSQPVKLLSFFLAGALLTTVSIGLVIVFVFRGSSLFSGSRPTFGPAVNIVLGAAALVAAHLVRRGGRPSEKRPRRERGPGWSERTLTRGAPLAFVVGIALNVLPGVFPLVALKNIAELDYAPGATVALVVGFYLIMFLPAEVPLGSYLVAPTRTAAAVDRFNSWLGRHARPMAVYALAAIGLYLIVRGIVALIIGGS